jgi:RHS repeat-associated protein
MKKIFFLLTVCLLTSLVMRAHAQVTGYSSSNSINAGSYNASGSFSNSVNSSTGGFTNNYGNAANDVWYSFTISSTASSVLVSLCGSSFDTYLHVLNSSGTEIASNDDNGPACSGVQSSISLSNLSPGTYYVDAEGYSSNSGTIDFSLSVSIVTPPYIWYPSGGYTFNVGTAISPITVSNFGGTLASTNQTLTFAGTGSPSSTDGTGTTASFDQPLGMVMDAGGNLYVADAGSHEIRKVTPSGTATTLAGGGYAGFTNGIGTSALFNHPVGLVIDVSGNLYVADEANNAIRKITPTGVVTTLAGSGTAGFTNGSGGAATFNLPCGVALDAAGNIYVADYNNNVIRKVTAAGMVTTYAGTGIANSTDGPVATATFNHPFSLAFDKSGNLFITDRVGSRIRKITPAGIVSTLAGSTNGYLDGTGAAAEFSGPTSLALDTAENVYVTDEGNQRIRKITSGGIVTTVAGSGSAGDVDGVGSAAVFNNPFAIASASAGYIYVGEQAGNLVRKIIVSPFITSPTLPQGLSISAATGTISGTPTKGPVATLYTITAYGISGQSARATIDMVVNSGPLPQFSANQNYVVTYTPRISGITNNDMVIAGSGNPSQVETNVQYIDGLTRAVQTVQVQGSPTGHDMVQPMAYDQYGRQPIQYLPYAATGTAPNNGSYKTTALTDQPAFYNSPPTGVVPIPAVSGVTPSFSQTIYELSPANRVTEQGSPGSAWQPVGGSTAGHTVKVSYMANDATTAGNSTGYGVAMYQVNIDASGNRTLVQNGNYNAGTLFVTSTTNENWTSTQTNPKLNTTEEYKDQDGHVVLKRTFNYIPAVGATPATFQVLSTYYVYDDRENLSFVLPPGANPDNAGLTSSNSQTILNNLCYQYGYDERNRLTQKKLPGKGWEYAVYNRQDQMILKQDANQRSNNQWMVSKYDMQGRVVMTGLWNAGSVISLSALQASIYAGAQYDTRNYSDNTTGYSITSYPALTNTLTINYYDDYNFPGGNPYAYSVSSQVSPAMPATASNMTYGLPTAIKVAVLNTIGNPTPDMLWSQNYYDDLGRTIATYKQHYLNGQQSIYNYDQYNLGYDFQNNVVSSFRQNFARNSTAAISMATIANTYVYNNMEIKKQTWEQLNGGTNVLLSQADYNEVGQMTDKKLHSINNGSSFLQPINYAYNERGWLLSSAAPLFSMTLQYNAGSSPQYNGNITSQSWSSTQSSGSYSYSYDALNRLTSGSTADGKYGETGISYDLEGNITAMARTYNSTPIDNLTYTYNGTNQLQSVNDLSGDASGIGYKAGNWTYGYDSNGNMVTDNSNGITGTTGVVYNVLNLPQSIPAKNTTYIYDASGRKLRRVIGTTPTDYIDGIEYDLNGAAETITFIQTEDGQIITPNTTPNYEYNLVDNLGNSRLTFDTGTGAARVVQQDNYMPFGMEVSAGSTIGTKNEYLYNNKELQENLQWYDYGARFYSPVIGRWMTVDPLAEMSRRMSPYNYVANNPIRLIDPDGMHYFGSIDRDDSGDDDPVVGVDVDQKEHLAELAAADAAKNAEAAKDGKEQGEKDVALLMESLNLGKVTSKSTDAKQNTDANQGDDDPDPKKSGGKKQSSLPIIKPDANGKFPSVQYQKDSNGKTYYVDRVGMVHYVDQGVLLKSVLSIPGKLSTWGGAGWSVMKGGYLGFVGGLLFGIMDDVQTQWWDNDVKKANHWMGTDGKEH